jgi:hypothetical protein
MKRDPTAFGSVLPPAHRAGIVETADRRQLEAGLHCCDRAWNVGWGRELKTARDSYDEGRPQLTPRSKNVFSLWSELCRDCRTLS